MAYEFGGQTGADGSTWYDGADSPLVTAPTATPRVGDFYLQTTGEVVWTFGDDPATTVVENVWYTLIETISGTDGAQNAIIVLYQRNSTPNTPPTTISASTMYTFDGGSLVGANNSWTQARPDKSNGTVLWAIAVTANGTGETETIAFAEWTAPQVETEDGATGNDGPDGSRGAGQYSGSTTLTADPGDNQSTASSFGVSAATAITNAGITTGPVVGDVVTLTNRTANQPTSESVCVSSDGTWSNPGGAGTCTDAVIAVVDKVFTIDGDWDSIAQFIDGNLVVHGTINADRLVSNGDDANGFRLGDGIAGGLTIDGSLVRIESTVISNNSTGGNGSSTFAAGVWGRVTGENSFGIIGTSAAGGNNTTSGGGAFGHFDSLGSTYENIVLLSTSSAAVTANGNVTIGDSSTDYTLTLNGADVTGGGTQTGSGGIIDGGTLGATSTAIIDGGTL